MANAHTCSIVRWCAFLDFMFQDGSMSCCKIITDRGYITLALWQPTYCPLYLQLLHNKCIFWPTQKRYKQRTYWLSKAKYSYQNNLPNLNNNTTNYRPTGQDRFQIQVQKGNEKAIQQHFSPSVVQTWGTWGIKTHVISITRFINATSKSHSFAFIMRFLVVSNHELHHPP